MIAVFKREFKNFFQNVIGWVFIAAMVFVAALYFYAYNIGYGMSDIVYMLYRLLLIVIFSIPVLTMRILSEERKQKTDQLTLTSPVSVGKIITGKYLSMVAVLVITVVILAAFPIMISRYTTIDWGINLLAVLGFLLYGSACIALCMFLSSFTESLVISAIIGIIVMFVVYLMSGICSMLDATENVILTSVSKALSIIDLASRFDNFIYGIVDIKSIVYFITVIIVFVFLTVQSVQKRRYSTSVKNAAMSAFSITSIVIVIAVAVIANLIVRQFPDKYTQFDLTTDRLYSITDATKNVVAEIDDPITIYVYAAESDKDEMVDRMLSKYLELSNKITVEYKDPNTNPKFYTNYTSSSPTYNCLFLENSQRNKYINYDDMYITDYSYNDDGSYNTTTSYDIEGQITSAINYLNSGLSAKIYEVTGHDELTLEDSYIDAINKQNFAYEQISLLGNDIPSDCELLIINAPGTDYSEGDVEKIKEYCDNGGNILIITGLEDDLAEKMPNYNSILEYYNVSVANGLIVDMKAFVSSPFYIIPDVVYDDVTTDIYNKKSAWMPYAKALKTIDEASEDVYVNSWLTSSTNSYRKGNVVEIDNYDYDENEDEAGPFDVAVTATKTLENGQTKAYIVGSVYMFSTQADQVTANANLSVFTNILNKSVNNELSAVTIPAKTSSSERFIINNSAGVIIFIILMVAVPVALLITGFVIWFRRRKY